MSKIQLTKRNVMEGVPFTTIPDDFLAQWMTQLSPSELRVMLYIYLRTLGFGKQADTISYSQFLGGIVTRDGRRLDAGAGVSRRALVDALAALEQKGLIRRYHQVVSRADGPCSAGNSNISSGKDALATFEVILLRETNVSPETAVTQLLSSSTSTSTNALITSDNSDEKEQENGKGKAVRRKRLDENHSHNRAAHQVQSLPYLVVGDNTHTGVVSQPQVQTLPQRVQVLPSQRQNSVQSLHHNMRPESLTINNNHENRGAGASVSVSGTTATGIRASIPHDLSAAGASTAHGHLVDLASPSRNIAQPPQTVDQPQSAGLPTDDDFVYRERAIGLITSQVIGITPREASRLVELAFTRYSSLTHSPNPSSSSHADLEGVNPQSETTFPGVTTPTQNVALLIPAGGGGAGQNALAYIKRLVEYVTTTPGIHTPAAVLTTLVKTGQDRTKASERGSLYPRRRRPAKPGSFSSPSSATPPTPPHQAATLTAGYPQVTTAKGSFGSTPTGLATAYASGKRMGYRLGPGSSSGTDYVGDLINNARTRVYPVAAAFVGAGAAQSEESSQDGQSAQGQRQITLAHAEQTRSVTPAIDAQEEERLDPRFLGMLQMYTPKLAAGVRRSSIEGNRLLVSFIGIGYVVEADLVGWLSMAQIYYPQLEEIVVLK